MKRKLLTNKYGSAVPIILFLLAIMACGGLHTLFMLEIAFPLFEGYIPASDSKTFIMMCMYAIPLFVIVIGVISLVKSGLKRMVTY